MRTKTFLLAFCLTLVPVLASAQIDIDEDVDLRGRISVGADKKLAKGLHLGVEEELRLGTETVVDKLHTSVSLNWKACPYFKMGASYIFISDWETNEADEMKYWRFRHRFTFDLQGMYKTGGWKFSLRERFQTTTRHETDFNPFQAPRTVIALKSRAKVAYAFHNVPLEPYLAFEARTRLNGVSQSSLATKNADVGKMPVKYGDAYFDRLRLNAGLEWQADSHNSLEFYFLADYNITRSFDCNKEGKLKNEYILNGNMEYEKRLSAYTTRGWNTILGLGYKFSF